MSDGNGTRHRNALQPKKPLDIDNILKRFIDDISSSFSIELRPATFIDRGEIVPDLMFLIRENTLEYLILSLVEKSEKNYQNYAFTLSEGRLQSECSNLARNIATLEEDNAKQHGDVPIGSDKKIAERFEQRAKAIEHGINSIMAEIEKELPLGGKASGHDLRSG